LKPRFVAYLAALTLLVSLIAASAATPAIAGSGVTRQIALAGTGSLITGDAPSGDASSGLEFPAIEEEESPEAFDGTIDRSLSQGAGSDIVAATAKKAKSNPQVNASFEGLNLFQQRYARRGNQFTVEPPDQGMCVGNGYIVEALNAVVNVFNYAGVSVLPNNTSTNIVAGFPTDVNHAVDLNSFYGYGPALNRGAGNVRGPFITDPSCYYDAQTQRFYVVVLTLEVVPTTGAFTTENHLDLAVSTSSNPTGSWKIYRVDVTGDGTHNTAANACPCLGDYPHIGADAYGFYITTNAYPWNGNGFNGAQIYAFSKRQLASGAATVSMTHIDTFGAVNVASEAGATQPGFTVWPAQSPGTASYELAAGGTEYFLSSNAADEATRPVSGTGGPGSSNKIVTWALTNTSSLDGTPSLGLSNAVLSVGQYAVPPKSDQPGSGTLPDVNTPTGHCVNDTTTLLFNGQTGCWRLFFGGEPAHNEVISRLDSNDTRMQQVMYANGKVWGALDTAVSFDTNPAHNKAGVAWYIVKPDVSTGSVSAKVALTGTNGVEGANITYPAIGVTPSGRGVVALTLVGPANFPSAAYAPIDAQAGMGDVQIVAAGAATEDGFTSYKSFVGNPPRTRWGDYGAAAVDGNSIWIASEYIAHACDYTRWGGQFFAGGDTTTDVKLGTCAASPGAAGPRVSQGNWSTRISKLTP